MKIICASQNDETWEIARLGLPTASNFDRIITPTGKACKGEKVDDYANELIAEMMLRKKVSAFTGNRHTERGKELEPDAVALYEMANGVETKVVGFCTNDAGTVGASPDRLVGEEGLIEVKTCQPDVVVKYLLSGKIDNEHKPQVQGQLWVTGRKWNDLVPYHPDMPQVAVRTERDEEFLALLETAMAGFLKLLAEKKAKMVELGHMESA